MLAPNDSNDRPSRRGFLLLLPIGIMSGVFATVVTAALRFLRPSNSGVSGQWIDVTSLSELKGNKPVTRMVMVEHTDGWAKTREEHRVYVLPAKNNQVLSAVCPHEGCEVAWQGDTNSFACPCHDSNFSADGSRINGPARRGLDPLPARVENGKLQIQYKFFINNTEERIARG